MKHCSSIDTDDILFKIVSEAVTSGKVVINGGVFTQGERPDDSEAEDIVINHYGNARQTANGYFQREYLREGFEAAD